MLITKQYVVFGTTEEEIIPQTGKIIDEFTYTGWNVKTDYKDYYNKYTVTKNNTKIVIKSCIADKYTLDKWDNCWISNKIDKETIDNIIMPLSISNTPEIHFF